MANQGRQRRVRTGRGPEQRLEAPSWPVEKEAAMVDRRLESPEGRSRSCSVPERGLRRRDVIGACLGEPLLPGFHRPPYRRRLAVLSSRSGRPCPRSVDHARLQFRLRFLDL